ncbi:hypothetical protein ACI79C_14140 [Geodermatophilus sp. SYSU D00697]
MLRWEGGRRFAVDLGRTNRYYAWAVGDGRTIGQDGLRLLADPVRVSPVLGPLLEESLGRGALVLPSDALDREHRAVQLMSFRTPARAGPAVSEVVRVPLDAVVDARELEIADHRRPPAADLSPPALPLAASCPADVSRTALRTGVAAMARPSTAPRPSPTYSSAFFIDVLLSALPAVLPTVAPLIGDLVGKAAPALLRAIGPAGGGAGGGTAAAPVDRAVGAAVGDPRLAGVLSDLVRQLLAAAAGQPAAGTPAAKAQPAPPVAMASGVGGVSTAMVAPALLAAIPALLPVLQQVLNPQTIQAVLQAPNQHLQTVTNAMRDFARLGIESHEQDLAHLRAIHPDVNGGAVEQLLASMSLGLSRPSGELPFRRVASVGLAFAGTVPLVVGGRTVLAYRAGVPLRFPVDVRTPRTIPQATVELCLKDADTLQVLHRARWRAEQVGDGRLLTVPEVDVPVPPGRDALVTVALVWRNAQGRPRGTSVQQRITVAGDLLFDRVEESGELIPLADPDQHRELWHRVWEGQLDGPTRIDVHTAYAYEPAPQLAGHQQRPTRVSWSADRRTLHLDAGLRLAPGGLAALLPRLDPAASPLTAAELAALADPALVTRLALRANHRGSLAGRRGSRVALYVHPEVKLQQLVLQRPSGADGNGHVRSFEEHRLRLPLPALVHVLGLVDDR